MAMTYGECPDCGLEKRLTPKKRLVASHTHRGTKCAGSGLEPVRVTRTVGVDPCPSPEALDNKAPRPGINADGSLISTGTASPHVAGPDAVGRNRGSRQAAAVWVSMAVLALVVGLSVFISKISGDETPLNASTAPPASATTSQPSTDTGSQSNWPVNQDGKNLAAEAQRSSDLHDSAGDTGTPGADDGIASALASAGVTSSDVDSLAGVAYETGYVWRSRPPTAEEKQTFAYMAVLECRQVAGGSRTWEDSAQEAVSTGASVADAARMASYLESSFCPGVT